MKLITYPNPILQLPCSEVYAITEDLLQNIDDMKKILLKYDGVGLAAPQVEISKSVFIRTENGKHRGEPKTYINPQFIYRSDEIEIDTETCLSVPWTFIKVPRHVEVKVRALDEEGEAFEEIATGWIARIIQHEMDHLQGKLILSYLQKCKAPTIKDGKEQR